MKNFREVDTKELRIVEGGSGALAAAGKAVAKGALVAGIGITGAAAGLALFAGAYAVGSRIFRSR